MKYRKSYTLVFAMLSVSGCATVPSVDNSVALARHLCLLNSSVTDDLDIVLRNESNIEVESLAPLLAGGVTIEIGREQEFISRTEFDGDTSKIVATDSFRICSKDAFDRIEAAKRERRESGTLSSGEVLYQLTGERSFESSRLPVPSNRNIGNEFETPKILACSSPSKFVVTWATGRRAQGGYCLVRPASGGCEVSARWEGPNPDETQFSNWNKVDTEKTKAKGEVLTGGYYTTCELELLGR